MKLIFKYITTFILFVILGLIILDFLILPIITRSSNNFYIPDLRKVSIYKAQKILEDKGFKVETIISDYNESVTPNTVIKMSPRAFSKVKKGRLIKLTISGEKTDITILDFYDMSLNNAKLTISRQGLLLDTIIYEYNNSIKKNHITSQYPKTGKILKTNDKITFVVSLGSPPNYYTVPNLINLNITTAKEYISKAGLLIGNIEYEYNPDYLNNTVLEQNLTPGVKLSFPNKINLLITKDKR